MPKPTRAPKISVHRVTDPIGIGSLTSTCWDVHIDGDPFARISSISRLVGSWRCHIYEPEVWSGEFYDKASARAWTLEMAARKLDPTRGPIVSSRTQYQTEVWPLEPA